LRGSIKAKCMVLQRRKKILLTWLMGMVFVFFCFVKIHN
jgi:hypothetical protein